MKTDYPLFLAGEFVTTKHILPVFEKFENREMAHTYLADKQVLNYAIQMAEKAVEPMKEMSSFDRHAVLNRIHKSILKNKNYLAEVLCKESAKPIRYALAEIDRAAQTFLISAEECKRLPMEYMRLDWTKAGEDREGLVKYFPCGIVAGISPFNFPLNLAVHKIAPAIAAGCPIILKPASTTPLSTLELAQILSESELPKGAVSVLPMNRQTGNILATDARIQLLSFTGSPEVGWELKKQSSKKKCILELGGNAGVIITPSANIHDAVEKCIFGGFSYSGQICIHAQRIYVHQNNFESFKELFVKKALALKYGNPLKQETEISDMIDERNAIRVENWIKEALNEGAELLCGGSRTGNYVEPTVLSKTNTKMKVNSEEVFGPVVCLEPYEGNIAAAVNLVNDSRFGLQCGIFTDSVNELNYCFENLQVGGVIHNHVPTLRFDHMPYGGVKDSGMGREGIKYAIQDMLEAKVLVK